MSINPNSNNEQLRQVRKARIFIYKTMIVNKLNPISNYRENFMCVAGSLTFGKSLGL